MGEWIPVSERLPEPTAPVILIHVGRWESSEPDRNYQDVGYLSDVVGLKYWSIRGSRAITIDAYTHWMPLPEPPK